MPNQNNRSTVIFLSIAALFIFFQLFRLPFDPILFEGDHSVHLSNAWRMYSGETPFQDFFMVTFPGTEIYYLTLYKLFGVQQWLLNATIFALLMGLSALGLYLSRRILTDWAVYVPVSLFLVIGFRALGIDGSHRFFGVLAVLAAIAVIFSKRTFPRIFWAGFFCGVSSIFTQQRGVTVFAAIALFLVIEKFYKNQSYHSLFKSFFCLTAPFALIIGMILIYFISTAGFESFYFATFVFPVKYYPADKWNNFGAYLREIPAFQSQSLFSYLKLIAPFLFFYLLVPAVYFVFGIIFWLKRKNIENEQKLQLILLNTVGFLIALGIFFAPSAIRLYQVSIPALITLIWSIQILAPRRQIMLALLVFAGFLGIAYSIQRQTVLVYPLDTPTGKILFFSTETLARYKWAAEHTQPLDYLYEPHHPSLYSIFKLKNPTTMSWLRPNNFTPDQHVSDVLYGLRKNQPRYIIWNGLWDEIAAQNRSDFHLHPLVDYLKNNYHRTETLNSFSESNEVEYKVEIYERNR